MSDENRRFSCKRCGGYHTHKDRCYNEVPWKRPEPISIEEAGRRTAEAIIRLMEERR